MLPLDDPPFTEVASVVLIVSNPHPFPFGAVLPPHVTVKHHRYQDAIVAERNYSRGTGALSRVLTMATEGHGRPAQRVRS